jgi:hypothetical protein
VKRVESSDLERWVYIDQTNPKWVVAELYSVASIEPLHGSR